MRRSGGGGTATLQVLSEGALQAEDTVQVGVDGPTLNVDSVNGTLDPPEVILENPSGSAVTVVSGDRLILTSRRPIVYAGPFGTTALGSTLTTDSFGQVGGYIDATPFDYTISPGSAVLEAVSTASLTGNGPSLSWSHPGAGPDSVVLVGISWQETTDTETLDTVTYGGQSMTRLGATGKVDLFYLLNPPTGTRTVVVTWSGTSAKGAVAGAASVVGLDSTNPLGTLQSAQGTGTSPSVTVSGTHAHGIVFSVVAVNSTAGITSLGTSQISLWNTSAGTAPDLTRTQGGGSMAAGTGGSVPMAWSLGASRLWGIVAVEAVPAAARLTIDAEGTAFAHSPFGINAADYPTLRAAVDAVPLTGGVVYVPAGSYILEATDLPIELNKPVRIVGEGVAATKVFVNTVPGNENLDLFRVQNSFCNIEGMSLYGYQNPEASGTGVGIRIGDPSPSTINVVSLRDLVIYGFASYGVQMPGPDADVNPTGGLDESVFEAVTVAGSGAHAQFGLGRGTTTTRLVQCRAYASVPDGPTSPTGVVCYEITNSANITLDTCEGAPPEETYAVHVKQTTIYGNEKDGGANITVRNCDFERAGRNSVAYLRAELVAGLVIEGNLFYDGSGDGIVLAQCFAPLVQGNVFKAIDNWCIYLDDCTNAVLVANTHEEPDGSGGARSAANYTDGGNSTGTTLVSAGIVKPPSYPTSSRPAYDAQRVPNGSLCFDSTTGKLMVMSGNSWVVVGSQ